MYRPTVRYDDKFKLFVDEMFYATTLDRNQIIRAALFAAAHSKEFTDLMVAHSKNDLPMVPWSLDDERLWKQQSKGENVNVVLAEETPSAEVPCDQTDDAGEDRQSPTVSGNAGSSGKVPVVVRVKPVKKTYIPSGGCL